MMRITDGYVPTELEQTYEWLDNIPPVHVTTQAEWETIRALWRNEKVRGAEPLYWEDVQVGDETVPTCSGPVSDMDMFRLHGDMIRSMPDARGFLEAGEELMTDAYGQKRTLWPATTPIAASQGPERCSTISPPGISSCAW